MLEYMEIKEYVNAIHFLSKSKLYIVGSGRYGEILGRYFDKNNIKWEGYIDKRTDLVEVNGKPVYSYKKANNDNSYYVISTFLYKQELIEELKNHGIKTKQIILYENQQIFYDIYADLVNWKVYTDKLKIFYKKYEGERCFIIGNGPSLSIVDLEKLVNEYTFASNAIYGLYKHTHWRPTYYCTWDPIFCKKMLSKKEFIRTLLQGCTAAFTSIIGNGFQYRDDADIKNLYFMKTVYEEPKDECLPFSKDCSKKICIGGSITYGMLQLAVYMGFKKIYLLGMDLCYSVERHFDKSISKKEVCNHTKEIEEEEKQLYHAISSQYGETYVADIDLQTANFQMAKQYADTNSIQIYNATRGGKLEVFDRVNFDNLFD